MACRSETKVPVMFWIHGGAFILGTGGPAFYGPDDFMDTEEVILVSINYRCGNIFHW